MEIDELERRLSELSASEIAYKDGMAFDWSIMTEHGEIDGGFRRSGNRLARSGIMRRNRCRLAESVLFGHGSSLSFRLVIHRAVWVIYER